jgi:amino acid transporter
VATAVVDDRELIKAMRWYDGFVVAMSNPTFLITALGGSVATLGGWGAISIWAISIMIGGLHNNLYAELAAMFPKMSGGIAVYAHEAWKKYTTLVGPVAAIGYWIGWSVVLSISGAIVGFMLQAQFFPSSTFGTTTKSLIFGINFNSSPAILIGAVIILVIWVANVFGVRPAVWMGYVTAAALSIPLFLVIVAPYITGDFHSSNLTSTINWSSTGDTGWRLVITWLYLACWSSYGFECCATFAPEYYDPAQDTAKALRAAAVFSIFTYILFPLGAVGTLGDKNITFNNALTFYSPLFKELFGSTAADLLIILLCIGIVLSMNAATMDGSRALYGISQDGMTIRWLGKLNRNLVPGNAMTLDAVLNLVLLFTAIGTLAGGGYLKVLAVSNLGYVLSHIFAVYGYLLLRKDRPDMDRPIRLASWWMPVAGLVLLYDIVLIAIGSWSFSLTGYPGGSSIWISSVLILVIALLLFVFRTVVEDKKPMIWKIVPGESR